jgi:hypothetical protein
VRTTRVAVVVVCCTAIALFVAAPALRAQRSLVDPQTRLSAQQKISAPLMTEVYRRRGDARRAPKGTTGIRVDRHGRTLVRVHAPFNDALKRKIAALGGRVMSSATVPQEVVALMPVSMLERLAADDSVRAITAN